MQARFIAGCCLCFFILSTMVRQAHGQAEASFETAPIMDVTKDYLFRAPGGTDWALREQPIMVWSNPATFDQKGIVLVWTEQGRPQLVATLFQSTHPDGERMVFEGHSLARGQLEAMFKGTRFWKVDKPGVIFHEIEELSPAPLVNRRQLQMRQLAREFQVVLSNEKDKQSLRLLPTPVLTYEPNTDQCVDGAMFAFTAIGTDPDAFLLIETVRQKNALQFQYGFVRFHYRQLVATRKDQTVWQADEEPGMLNNFRGSTKYKGSVYNFFRAK